MNFENINRDISILYKDEINYAFNNIIQNAIQHSKIKFQLQLIKNLRIYQLK